MSFAELLAEVKNLSPSEKEALRSFLAGDLLNQEESEEFLTRLDLDAARADAGNKVYTIKETREMGLGLACWDVEEPALEINVFPA
jgi:hypothetical protein